MSTAEQEADLIARIDKEICAGHLILSDSRGVARCIAGYCLDNPYITLSGTDALTLALAILRKDTRLRTALEHIKSVAELDGTTQLVGLCAEALAHT